VLCDLESKPRKEAARQLGWPEGTLSSRLAAARRLLARRLTRHGLTLSGGALAAALAQNAVAAVPPPLILSTVQAAARFAAGATAAAGSAPASVLAKGVIQVMLLDKLKALAVTVLALVLTVAGAGFLVRHGLAADPTADPKAAEPRPAAEDKKEARDAEPWAVGPHLITNKSVQEELKVTEKQKAKIKDALEEIRKAQKDDQEKLHQEFQKLRKEFEKRAEEKKQKEGPLLLDQTVVIEMQRKMGLQTAQALGKALPDILIAEQVKRLKQIQLRQLSIHAFFLWKDSPGVVAAGKPAPPREEDLVETPFAKSLGLTEGQKRDIRKIIAGTGPEMTKELEKFQDDRDKYRKEAPEVSKRVLAEALKKVVAVLDVDQKKEWEKAVGEPFEFKPDPQPERWPPDGQPGRRPPR
jgi:hypothetical protein